jgi:hypothetical protein
MLIKLYDVIHKNDLLEKIWIGKVVDNNDPRKLGRIKVMIDSLFGGISINHLPWVSPIKSVLLGSNSSTSHFSVPEIGTFVIVKFEKTVYNGYYIGEIQSLPTHQSLFDENYPETYGFQDASGNYFKINKSTKTIEVYHSSGTHIVIDQQGNISIQAVGDVNINAKNINLNC